MTARTQVSRLPPLADPPDDPLLRELFAETRRRGGQVINLHLTLGHAPKVFRARRIMATTLRYEAAAPRALCELAIIRTAQILGGDYELNQHIPMALEAGLTREQLDEVANWEDSDLFDDKQLAVLPMWRRWRQIRARSMTTPLRRSRAFSRRRRSSN